MNIRMLIAATLLGSVVSAADQFPSRLRYVAPEKWTRSVDPTTQVVSLISPDGKAALSFASSVEFSGTAQEWQSQMWEQTVQMMKPAGPLAPGKQGEFLTRTGVFQQPDGSTPWVSLYTLVQDGRAEAMLFLATGDLPFFAHLGTVNGMIPRITVAPLTSFRKQNQTMKPDTPNTASPSKSPAASPVANQSGTAGGNVDGLYLATTRQLRFNAFGGSGSASWEVATEFYLLARDGRVFRGRDLPQAPGGDISRFDYATAQREVPGNFGRYLVRGDEVVLTLGDAPAETISAKRIAPDALEIRGTTFKRGIREKSPTTASP